MKKFFAYLISLLMIISLVTMNSAAIVHAEDTESSTPDASNDFYEYWLPGTPETSESNYIFHEKGTYRVSLTDSFKNELNKESDGSFTGVDAEGKSITWKTGDPLPNPDPSGEYNGKKITSFERTFSGISAKSLDLSCFDTSNVTNMRSMFVGCWRLSSLDLSSFNTSKVTNMSDMFDNCVDVTSLDLSKFDTSKVKDTSSMFWTCIRLTSLDLSNFDTSNVTNMGYMFSGCRQLTQLDVGNLNTSKVTNMIGTFGYCEKLTSLDLSSFDTSNVTDMSGMFQNCKNLSSLDLSSFNTSKVESMDGMFSRCWGITSLDLSCFDVKNVNGISGMFNGTCANSDLTVTGYAKNQGTADLFNNSDKTDIDTSKLKFVAKVIAPTNVSLSENSITLYPNDKKQLKATITPDNATDKTVNWTSSNEKVAAVDQEGNVKAVSKGAAVITATSNVDTSKTASCTVTVNEKASTSSNQNTQTENNTSSSQKSASVNTRTAVDNSKSSNTKSTAVDTQKQAISSITKLMAKTGSDQDLKGSVYNKLQLKASKTSKTSVTVKWKKVAGASKYLVYGNMKGSKYKLLKTTSGSSFTNKSLKKGTYYKYVVVAVDNNGKKLSTSKVVLATTSGGKTKNPTGVKVNKSKVTLKKNKSFKIKAKLNGKKLKTYKKIAYESSNTKVATVSKSGKITAKKKGKATIYVYAQNGVSKTIKVTVK